MIYLVSGQQQLFDSSEYHMLSVHESLNLLNQCEVLQYDSETSGRNPHLCSLLCVQFGNDALDIRIVVDCTTVSILLYKNILESKFIIGHNLKFDLQFLYNYGIVPRKVYDTMIVDQLLYLGYPQYPKPGSISHSLNAVAERLLDINIDKTVRGEIIWRGLDINVILYAAGDVTYLEKIMYKQIELCRQKECLIGAKLECDFVPAIAYLEWCGIKLNIEKWQHKMDIDNAHLNEAKNALDSFLINHVDRFHLHEFIEINNQGDLFSGFDLTPKANINWDSSKQVIVLAKKLGFNTTVQDKQTGEDKDSVLEKTLKVQKGINDEFLDLYFTYKEYKYSVKDETKVASFSCYNVLTPVLAHCEV